MSKRTKYKLKSTIEAIQFTGDNWGEISEFCPDAQFSIRLRDADVYIPSHYGGFNIYPKDWLIKYPYDNHYAVMRDGKFEENYEPVD